MSQLKEKIDQTKELVDKLIVFSEFYNKRLRYNKRNIISNLNCLNLRKTKIEYEAFDELFNSTIKDMETELNNIKLIGN